MLLFLKRGPSSLNEDILKPLPQLWKKSGMFCFVLFCNKKEKYEEKNEEEEERKKGKEGEPFLHQHLGYSKGYIHSQGSLEKGGVRGGVVGGK